MMLAQNGHNMADYEFPIAGADMLVSTAAQHIAEYQVWQTDAIYEMAIDHHAIWWQGYTRVEESCYNLALPRLQTPWVTNAEAIGAWWRQLCPSQARMSIVYQDRQPPDRTGKPEGLSKYSYCNHWRDGLWFKEVSTDVTNPTDYYRVRHWYPIGMVPFEENYVVQVRNGANMAAA